MWQPLPGSNGYAIHPDGRLRDRHRNIITDPAIIAALIPPKSSPMVRLACCGQPVRIDQPSTAEAHWSDCLQDMLATGSPRNAPRGRLDPNRHYSRENHPRRAPRRAVLGEPLVLAHNGQSGPDRRLRTMPWSAAVRIMLQQKDFGDELSEPRRAS